MAFLLYFLGLVVVISGLAWIATLAGFAQIYVSAAAMALLAVGVLLDVANTRSERGKARAA